MSEISTWVVSGCCALALLIGGGCGKPAAATASAPADPGEPTQAQPKLQTMKIFIGPEQMNAELALTPVQIRTGMMYRTTRLGEDEGMLFPLPENQRASFWMKHCPVPLSAAYINPDGIIEEIHLLEANNTNPVVAGSDNIRFVLETSEGWFVRHHIQPGTAVATERGPLLATFFGKH